MTPLQAAGIICEAMQRRTDDTGNTLLQVDYYEAGDLPEWLESRVERYQRGPTSPPVYMIPINALARFALGGQMEDDE